MPEATILYSVTGVVVAGLVVWVAMVLSMAKQPWVRPAPAEEPAAEEVAEVAATEGAATEAAATPAEPASSPDDTARQTPVALSTGRAKAAVIDAKVAEAELEAEKEAEKKAGST